MPVFVLIFEYSSRTSQNDVTHVWNHGATMILLKLQSIAFAKSMVTYDNSAKLTVNPNMHVISSLEVVA